jgi:hypothetical protein
MVPPESLSLMCNICGKPVSASEANQHASTNSHQSHKATLEQDLLAVRRQCYQNDSSVLDKWNTDNPG